MGNRNFTDVSPPKGTKAYYEEAVNQVVAFGKLWQLNEISQKEACIAMYETALAAYRGEPLLYRWEQKKRKSMRSKK